MGFRCSRRDLLTAATALAALGTTGLASAAGPAGVAAAPRRARAVPQLVAGLKLGECTLVRLLPIERAALPFELRDPRGHLFVVEAHRHDPRTPGIARAGSLDVFLSNGGTGATPTDETHGLAAMALARVLAARERAGHAVPELATIAERWGHDPPPRAR